jgi:peptidoglycan/xylan/chitin deacetylase (PgdA/CDA1 family)
MSGRTVRWLMSLVHRPHWAGPRLVVIRHHRVYAASERPLYRLGVREDVLAGQLAMLRRLGLPPVTLSEGLARLDSGESRVTVAMTFDDGYADNVHRAVPLLAASGGRATFYLAAGLMDSRRAPWWDVLEHVLMGTRRERLTLTVAGERIDAPLGTRAERAAALYQLLPAMRVAPEAQALRLEALAADLEVRGEAPCALATWGEAAKIPEAGMEVGAHTLTHPYLGRLEEDAQEREIGGSRDLVERRLGVRPLGLAYPGGDYDDATLRVVERLGFEHAVTTRAGDNAPGQSRFELRRRGLSEGACLGPGGRFSGRLTLAELGGAFDRLRGVEAAS